MFIAFKLLLQSNDTLSLPMLQSLLEQTEAIIPITLTHRSKVKL